MQYSQNRLYQLPKALSWWPFDLDKSITVPWSLSVFEEKENRVFASKILASLVVSSLVAFFMSKQRMKTASSASETA